MDKFVIKGGNRLKGEIDVAGAKNSALKLLPAALLTKDQCVFANVPKIRDVEMVIELLKDLGASVEVKGDEVKVQCDNIKKTELNPDLVKKLRASIMFLAPMLARFGEVKFPHPGGCIIGKRPIDIYLDGFKALGAEVKEDDKFYNIKSKKLKGSKFVFPWISHTVTESMIMAAVLAEGETKLINTASEPEVFALCKFLSECGAKIKGAGTHEIIIEGINGLNGSDAEIIPDRIEVGTFAIMAALTGDGIEINKCRPDHLEVFWEMMRRAGIKFDLKEDSVYIYPTKGIKATELRTHEYPGFVTDLQAPFTLMMTQAEGMSLIHETIYEGRLFYTDKLNKMGANIIMCDPHRVVVNGPTKLYGTKMESPDLRAGIALVIAALIAEGESEIDNIYQIDRGYQNIEGRLRDLGAEIKRINVCKD